MVSQENVGYADQLARLIVAVFLVFVFFMNLFSDYSIVILILSAAIMYTAVLRSCEPYTWFGFKTSDTVKEIPLDEAVEKLVGVVALYMVLFLLKYYLI